MANSPWQVLVSVYDSLTTSLKVKVVSTVSGPVVGTSTLSNVSASASSVTVLASNSSRLGAVFYNDSTETCYLKFGSTASSTSFTYKLLTGEALVIKSPVYTGIVTGIWVSATGSMRVTELT